MVCYLHELFVIFEFCKMLWVTMNWCHKKCYSQTSLQTPKMGRCECSYYGGIRRYIIVELLHAKSLQVEPIDLRNLVAM